MRSLNYRLFKLLAAVALACAPVLALAAGQQPFNASAFKAAENAGKAILLEIHADWCPTCKAQAPILDKVSRESRYSHLVRFRVDFDSHKDIVKKFNARSQSTLVLFKGEREIARSVGETDEGRIRAMLDKAL